MTAASIIGLLLIERDHLKAFRAKPTDCALDLARLPAKFKF